LADVAIGLAVRINTGIVETIAVFSGAFKRIKTLGSDGQDAGIHACAAGFYVDHDIHADIITWISVLVLAVWRIFLLVMVPYPSPGVDEIVDLNQSTIQLTGQFFQMVFVVFQYWFHLLPDLVTMIYVPL
jgi:hypothetical protein